MSTTGSENYSESSFWEKCKNYTKDIGMDGLEKALQLYYVLESDKCEVKDKAIIYGALAYLVSPIDVIPDLTPILGYTDDIAVMTAALAAVAIKVDTEVRAKATTKLKEWFS